MMSGYGLGSSFGKYQQNNRYADGGDKHAALLSPDGHRQNGAQRRRRHIDEVVTQQNGR